MENKCILSGHSYCGLNHPASQIMKDVADRHQFVENCCEALRSEKETLAHDLILNASRIADRCGRPRSEPKPKAR